LNLLLNEQMPERHIANLCPNLTLPRANSWTNHSITYQEILLRLYTCTLKNCATV